MIFSYMSLKSLPETLKIGILFRFLGKIKNTRLRPSNIDDDCPPVLFWWFEENDETVNQFIAHVVKSYPWEVPWTLEAYGNNKWLLYPTRIQETERKIQSVLDKPIKITDNAVACLMRNDPEFGHRANKDLDRFRIYFREKIEVFLKKKEQLDQGLFKKSGE